MANVRGGDISQLMIGGREMDPKKEANVTYRLSGFVNENEITGNGEMHTKQTRKLGGFESLPISLDPSRQDLEYLQETANNGEPVPMSMTLKSGQVYSGDLAIEGDLDGATGDGQVDLSALGPRFEQI